MTALVMLLVIVMIDGDSGDSVKVTISDSGGRGGVTSEAAVRKSGSYGLERTEERAKSQSERTKAVRGEWLVMERLLFTAG